jgi:hypothetical protein
MIDHEIPTLSGEDAKDGESLTGSRKVHMRHITAC